MAKTDSKIDPNQRYLITTDNWFFAPDGEKYCGVWGRVNVHSDTDILGIKTNEKSTNWYVWVGSDDKGVLVAGCQIHYATICPEPPPLNNTSIWSHPQNGVVVPGKTPQQIYIAE